MKRLHVFRSGTHRTAGGRELSFSEGLSPRERSHPEMVGDAVTIEV